MEKKFVFVTEIQSVLRFSYALPKDEVLKNFQLGDAKEVEDFCDAAEVGDLFKKPQYAIFCANAKAQ